METTARGESESDDDHHKLHIFVLIQRKIYGYLSFMKVIPSLTGTNLGNQVRLIKQEFWKIKAATVASLKASIFRNRSYQQLSSSIFSMS